MEKINKMFLGLAGAVVAAAIIGGFFLVGSPATQRKMAEDQRRVQDLQQIASELFNFMQSEKYQFKTSSTLPATLPEFSAKHSYLNTNDVVSGKPYEYRKLSAAEYELCAEFNMASEKTEAGAPMRHNPSKVDAFWQHAAGRHCYKLDIGISPYSMEAPYPVTRPVME